MGFTGIDVKGTPNRQSKVPGFGSDQKTSRQSISEGAPNDQAQDESGYGSVSTSGIGDGIPGHTTRLSPCAKAAQDSGSHAGAFQGVSGDLNKGAGSSAGSLNWHPAQDASMNGQKSVDGNTTPDGRKITGDNKDIGVQNAMLFPGIIE